MTIEHQLAVMADRISALEARVTAEKPQPLAVNKKEAARLCGVSPDVMRDLYSLGRIRTVRFGTVERVPISALVEFIDGETLAHREAA